VSDTKDYEVDVVGVREGEVKVYTVTGEGVDVVNVEGDEKVGVAEGTWDGKGRYKFGRHSFTMLRWKA
jgi:alpha-N-arabinofuranosidase